MLFTLTPLLPPDVETGGLVSPKGERERAQQALVEYLKTHKHSASLLVARYVARQITIETSKMLPPSTPSPSELQELTDENSTDYGIGDHLERLRFLDTKVSDEETKLICDVFGAALPGLEQSLTEERHATTLGKMLYNAIGVCYSGGRDDRVCRVTVLC